jgi:tetratricopeptide (TPR) repeat protein
MENLNNKSEKFKTLVEAFNKEKHKLLTINQLSDFELRTIIKLLEDIILIAENNNDFVTIIEFRQFLLDRANSYLQLKDYSTALQGYEKIKTLIQSDERDYELHLLKCLDGISFAKARMGKYAESLKDCNELIAYAFYKKILFSKFFLVRGCCYRELGNSILADRSFELAENEMFLDRIITDEGDESLSTGLTAMGYNAIGHICFKHNLLSEALLNYEKAIELNPLYVKGYFNKGVVLLEVKNDIAAIQAFSKTISLDPNYLDAYLNRGNAYCYISDYKSAINDYNFCLAKDPSNQLAKENREYAKSMLVQQG